MVHQSAADGFGSAASTYQKARPNYHPELIAGFLERYGAGDVLEIGSGTGIFTQPIVKGGAKVVAVEPVAAMRDRLTEAVPGVDVCDGTAEALPVGSNSFDTVAVAQSFHWFDYPAALDEIDRVLRPGGHLVTVWNVKAGDAPWFARYMGIVDRHAGDTPRHADMRWRAAIDADHRFQLVEDWAIDHPRPTDKAGIVSRALSTSFISALPDDDQNAVASELIAMLDDVQEPLSFPYRAELQAWETKQR